MFTSIEFIVAAFVTVLIFVIILLLFFSILALKKRLQFIETNTSSNDILINQLQTLFIQLEQFLKEQTEVNNTQNIELNQVSKQLEHRIKNIQEDITKLQQTQALQPEDKLYSRAFKLVELGADAQELVRECDIPRAEADILISIHQKRNRS